MEKKTWLEVSLNGPWGRGKQPAIPVAVDEIVDEAVACAKAGAAIIHVHAYDETTGKAEGRWRAVRPHHHGNPQPGGRDRLSDRPNRRRAGVSGRRRRRRSVSLTLEYLAQGGLLEWAAVDPGSVNFAHYDDLREDKLGFVYLNPEEHIRYGLDLARQYRFHPAYAIYEPGFLRLGATLHWRCSSPAPIYRFMFSSGLHVQLSARRLWPDRLSQAARSGRTRRAVDDRRARVDVLPMIPRVVMEGGHVRVGLEDAPFGSERSNLQWVEAAAKAIDNSGGELATATDVRAVLQAVEMGDA